MWALRLIVHLGKRYKGVEDWRYTLIIRDRWRGWSNLGKAFACYHYVFVNQTVIAMLNNGSAMHIMRYGNKADDAKDWRVLLGVTIWSIGFFFESVGDAQLQNFRDDPENKGKILKTGLWRYTRHPNYFGETFLWWGIYIIACSGTSLKYGGHQTIYSSLVNTFLLYFVSGVRMLETKS